MQENAAAANEALVERLAAFAEWRAVNLRGDEKSEAQIFLDRLFQALGWGGVLEAGADLEFRVGNNAGTTSFADLLWKPRVLIEMKKVGASLERHLNQAFNYWVHAVPNRPRYVILCNFDEFWIYDFENQIDAPVERIPIHDIAKKWESLGFLLPEPVRPIFGNDLVGVTRDAAADVAKVYKSLTSRGVDAPTAQRFVLQSVMAMFAEDVGLLPEHSFTKALLDSRSGSEAFDLIGGLFTAMNTPGRTAGGRYIGTPYFNGGLFASVSGIELDESEVELLRDACRTQWSQVRPEIFGTLFEGSMDAGERHATGAHFTSQVDIQRIVQPVLIEPWRERISSATSIKQLNAILNDLSQIRVLDPACGSGNFLYVAYRELRRLEREVIERIRERRRSEGLAGQESFGYVMPEQFFGIDINSFAIEVAKVTMLLGKRLADDEMGEIGQTLPLNNLDDNFNHADALFIEWPPADVIIGNPPFLGRRKMVAELGAAYCAKLDHKFGPKGVSDFVTYWFPLAHDHLNEGGRAGLVGTKSIKQGDGRKASLDYLVENDGFIFDAVELMPWSGDASVTVSIVNWQKGEPAPSVARLWLDLEEPPLHLPSITSALSAEVDLRSVVNIAANKDAVFQGQTFGITEAFRIDGERARALISANSANAAVIHPVLGGKELLKLTSLDTWVVDVPFASADDAWRRHPEVMEHLEATALPQRVAVAAKEAARNLEAKNGDRLARTNQHHSKFLDRWWMLAWRREAYLTATAPLKRYIALTRTSSELRGPVFSFVDGKYRVSDSIVAFPFDDDFSFGVLQSSTHEKWFRARCTTLETRLTYTSNAIFTSFVWPQNPTQAQVDRVVRASRAIVDYRADAFAAGFSLAGQYDVLRRPGASTLRSLHEELDGAVEAAYGFDSSDILTQLFELNRLCELRSAAGEAIVGPGPRASGENQSEWSWPLPPQPGRP